MLPRDLDPWGEWRNPGLNPDVEEFLVAHRPTYAQSVGFIRAERPRENNHEATAWWGTTPARAHLINALLRRGSRTVEAVERELGIPSSKIYYYLREFRMAFQPRPGSSVVIIGYKGELYEGWVLKDYGNGRARLVVPEQGAVVEGEWSRTNQAFRLSQPLPRTVPLRAAAESMGVKDSTLRKALKALGVPVYQRAPVPLLERMLPERAHYLGGLWGS